MVFWASSSQYSMVRVSLSVKVTSSGAVSVTTGLVGIADSVSKGTVSSVVSGTVSAVVSGIVTVTAVSSVVSGAVSAVVSGTVSVSGTTFCVRLGVAQNTTALPSAFQSNSPTPAGFAAL